MSKTCTGCSSATACICHSVFPMKTVGEVYKCRLCKETTTIATIGDTANIVSCCNGSKTSFIGYSYERIIGDPPVCALTRWLSEQMIELVQTVSMQNERILHLELLQLENKNSSSADAQRVEEKELVQVVALQTEKILQLEKAVEKLQAAKPEPKENLKDFTREKTQDATTGRRVDHQRRPTAPHYRRPQEQLKKRDATVRKPAAPKAVAIRAAGEKQPDAAPPHTGLVLDTIEKIHATHHSFRLVTVEPVQKSTADYQSKYTYDGSAPYASAFADAAAGRMPAFVRGDEYASFCPGCGLATQGTLECRVFRCAFPTDRGKECLGGGGETGTKNAIAHATYEDLVLWRSRGLLHATDGCLAPYRYDEKTTTMQLAVRKDGTTLDFSYASRESAPH